jgi:hypothetical protein
VGWEGGWVKKCFLGKALSQRQKQARGKIVQEEEEELFKEAFAQDEEFIPFFIQQQGEVG